MRSIPLESEEYSLSRGFTFAEVMIVLLIIGILVAIALPIYISIINTANTRACQSNLKILDSAANQYNAKYGDYPVDNPPAVYWQDQLIGSFVATEPFCQADSEHRPYEYSNISHRFTCPVAAEYGHYY